MSQSHKLDSRTSKYSELETVEEIKKERKKSRLLFSPQEFTSF